MLIRIDPTDRAPIFTQIAASIRGSIARSDLRPGDRLPAARDLADSLEVNVHTVLRGYQILRDEGIVELRRGRGAVVSDQALERAELAEAIDRVVAVAQRFGVSAAELSNEIAGRLP